VKVAIVMFSVMCAALAAGLGAKDLSNYRQGKDKEEHPGWVLIDDNKALLIIVLTFLGGAPPIGIAVSETRKNRKKNKELVVRYLQLIHTRSFPHSEEGMSRNHRVSLYVAGKRWSKSLWTLRKRVLRCVYRTAGRQPTRTWDLGENRSKNTKELQNLAGVLVQAWVLQATITIAPPIEGDEDSQERYRKEAGMTKEVQKDMSWPNAGMHAVPLLTGASEPLAILLAESDGIEIACSELKWDAKTMAIILGDNP
jgi:hypothetical protein